MKRTRGAISRGAEGESEGEGEDEGEVAVTVDCRALAA